MAQDPAIARLSSALRDVHQDLRWFFAAGGSVSRDDMASMIRQAQKRVEGVSDLLWPAENAKSPATQDGQRGEE